MIILHRIFLNNFKSRGAQISALHSEKFRIELKNYHLIPKDTLVGAFNSNITNGLSEQQVKQLLKEKGYNIMVRPYQTPLWLKFILCFFNGFAPLLWISAILVFIAWKPLGTPPSNTYNLALAIALLVVIFISGLCYFYQEVQSEAVIESFHDLLPPNALVLRNGIYKLIPPTEIVVGDIIQLQQGNKVPSDARILTSNDLKIDKSMITGI